MAMKFNDKLFEDLKKLTYEPAVIPAPNNLESVLTVCEQRCERARKDAFNSNCIIDGIPFTWDYTSYNAVVDPEDSSNNLDITYRILTFPMVKRTTTWKFFLDIEENGTLYISEGKGTQRTRIPLRMLNDLHWAQRKIIADTIRQLCRDDATAFEFCETHGALVTVDYSYILGRNVPTLKECQDCRGYKYITRAQCELRKCYSISNELPSYIVSIFRSDENYWYYTHLYDNRLYDDVHSLFMESNTCGGILPDFQDIIRSKSFNEKDVKDGISVIKNIPVGKRVFFDISILSVFENYKDIPDTDKANIFVKDSRYDRSPYFNDIIDIDLYNDKVLFEHDHNEVFNNR